MERKTVAAFIAGIEILSKYMEDGKETKWFIASEHDVLYIGGEGCDPKTDDGIELVNLGFHFDDECDSWAWYA